MMGRRRWARSLATTALAAAMVATSHARAEDAAPIVIAHALVYGPGDHPPLPDTTVIIVNGKVTAVGSTVTVPSDSRFIDARGKTITAGFIDADTDVGAVEISEERTSNDADDAAAQPLDANGDSRGLLVPALRMADAYNPRSTLIPVARAGGVTSVVVAPHRGLFGGQSAFVDLAGDTQAEAIVRPALAQYARADEGEALEFGTRAGLWMTLRRALDDARFYASHKAQYDANATRPLALRRLNLEALGAVLRGEQPLVVTVYRASDIETALRLADEFKIKLVLRGASEAWLMRDELAKAKVPVIVDPLEDLPESFERLRSRSDNAALLWSAGVPVVLSTFSSHQARLLWQRAGNAVRLGMDHGAAIRAVTEAPADAFGLKGYGRIEPGAIANVVVWGGDPLQIGTKVEHVFVRGREEPLQTRQTLLLDRYRTLPTVRDGSNSR
jgi:imidazolonepropionase-like amidohydrolase